MVEQLQNKLDQKLFERFCALPLFEFYKLIKPSLEYQEKQRLQFFKTLESPVFVYPLAKAFDTKSYISKLEECKKDITLMKTEPWILTLYLAKLDELKKRALMVEAVSVGNDDRVCEIAKELFCSSQLDIDLLEQELENMISDNTTLHAHVRRVDAKMFEQMVREVLDHYQMNDWKIKFHSGSSVKLTRARKAKYLVVYIPKKFKASR
ncbi:hypothetical protein KKH24_02745, partial [Patescibacteria group bacterium]|nr:hypothetical protein [Patescibacteria group bacterium]